MALLPCGRAVSLSEGLQPFTQLPVFQTRLIRDRHLTLHIPRELSFLCSEFRVPKAQLLRNTIATPTSWFKLEKDVGLIDLLKPLGAVLC